MVDEPVAHHPVPHPGLAHQVDRALLQDPGLDRLLDRLAGLEVDHHRLHSAQVQQVRQQQPRPDPGPDDPHLSPHRWFFPHERAYHDGSLQDLPILLG